MADDWNIPLPPVTAPNVVNAMRAAQPLPPFDEAAALSRMQQVRFLRTLHENAAKGHAPSVAAVAQPHIQEQWRDYQGRVQTYAVVKAPAPLPTLAPLPAASVPRTPRPTVPAPVQPTPAFAAITNRTAQRAGLSQAANVIGALWSVKTPFSSTDSKALV